MLEFLLTETSHGKRRTKDELIFTVLRPEGVLFCTWEMSDPVSEALMDCLLPSSGRVGNAQLM